MKLPFEFAMRLGIIGADAQNHHTRLLVGRVIVTKIAGFFGTAGSIVRGIEIQHHVFPAKLGESSDCVGIVQQLEIGGRYVGREWHGTSFRFSGYYTRLAEKSIEMEPVILKP
jgi:hypothetical protein